MQTITHYEVYEANLGQWSLAARFSGREREAALAHARGIEQEHQRPIAVIEETENLANTHFDIQLIERSAGAGTNIRPPASQSDLGSRLFMVALNGIAIGAIAVVLFGVALANVSLSSSLFNILLAVAFVGGALLGGLILFKIYIPRGLILWRAKEPEARKRTIHVLLHGRLAHAAAEPMPSPIVPHADDFGGTTKLTPPPPPVEAPPPAADPAIDDLDTTAQLETDPITGLAIPAPLPPTDAQQAATAAMDILVDRVRAIIAMFTDEAMAELALRPPLEPAERFAVNLYLAGAVLNAGDRNALDPSISSVLLRGALERTGLDSDAALNFVSELDIAAERPRFRRIIEDGSTAIGPLFGDGAPGSRMPLAQLLAAWVDPVNQVADPAPMVFLLTDIVGSTALTSQIGNAGAQRVVRAHNALCRAASKAFRGKEVKHTGDGMLMLFPDATAAARAAMDIQQEATGYARDNPTAPLVLRVGLHLGDAVFEEGEYFGPAVTVVNGVCSIIESTEIGCTAAIRERVGTSFRFQELGARTVKGNAEPVQIFKLLWEQKRSNTKSTLEYRQIGTKPAAGKGDK